MNIGSLKASGVFYFTFCHSPIYAATTTAAAREFMLNF